MEQTEVNGAQTRLFLAAAALASHSLPSTRRVTSMEAMVSIVKSLCEELEVTVAELMDGEISEENSVRTYDDEQILDLLRRTQELEKQKNMLYGIMLIVMGIAVQALSYAIGGSDFKDFISGLLLGLSIGEMLVGVYVVGKSLAGR